MRPVYLPVFGPKSLKIEEISTFSEKNVNFLQFLCKLWLGTYVPFSAGFLTKNAQIRLFWAILAEKVEKNVNFLHKIKSGHSSSVGLYLPVFSLFYTSLYWNFEKNVNFLHNSFPPAGHIYPIYVPVFGRKSLKIGVIQGFCQKNVNFLQKNVSFCAAFGLAHIAYIPYFGRKSTKIEEKQGFREKNASFCATFGSYISPIFGTIFGQKVLKIEEKQGFYLIFQKKMSIFCNFWFSIGAQMWAPIVP